MQPYVNPNYFAQYQQPQMNPYQQRMDFLQNYQQSLQQPLQPTQMSGTNQQMNVLGKMVDSIDVVKAMDIPMDGSMYYFPKADGSEIFGKQWLQNGQTRILAFKPVLEDNPNNLSSADEKLKFDLSDEATRAFMERFDGLEKQINDLMAKSMTKTPVPKAKKESEAE